MSSSFHWNRLTGSLALISVLALPTPSRAQCCQTWAPGFEPNGIDVNVNALVVHNDGAGRALYAAAGANIEKWDGTNWFHLAVAEDTVYALLSFNDGNGPALYVAGDFTAIQGDQTLAHIAKWDGGWSSLGTGTNNTVTSLAIFDDGSGGGPALYAGGGFTTAGGVTVFGVAKWDGSNWSALGSGLDLLGHVAFALTVFDDGSGGGPALYAAGDFDSAGGVTVHNIAKWDGSSWSALGSGLNQFAVALTVHDDGSGGGPALYAGGFFTSAGGASANRIAKWDGANWSALGSGMSLNRVEVLGEFDDGSGSGPALYAGGRFDTAGGVASPNIAKWDGTSWSKVGRGTDGPVSDLVVFDDGSGSGSALFVGGAFLRAGTKLAVDIAKWDGSQWSALGGQGLFVANTHAMKAFDDGSGRGPELYIGGDLRGAGDVFVDAIARWNGTSWSSVDGIEGIAHAFEIFDDRSGGGTKLYVGGYLHFPGLTGGDGVAAWNGTSWSALGNGLANAFALAVFDDGSGSGPQLYAGGFFSDAGGVPAQNVARWDGANWSPLGSGVDGSVLALAVYDDGLGGGPMLVAAGDFATAGGASARCVARWDGSSWHPLGDGLSDQVFPEVRTLTVFDDGMGAGPKLYAGGLFNFSGTVPMRGIARWDGVRWTGVASNISGYVHDLEVFDEGAGRGSALYVAGTFGDVDGVIVGYVARWDGAVWTPMQSFLPGLDYIATALGSFDDGTGTGPDLYVCGGFAHAGYLPSSKIARWLRGNQGSGQAVCFGDGSVVPCPCGNDGSPGHGCENSHGTGGAELGATGGTSLANDTLVLTSTGEGASTLSIFLEGGNPGPRVNFGDGLLCAVAPLVRLYTKVASGGSVSAPQLGDASISARSIAGGSALSSGQSRSYQVYYRDSNASFCPQPAGDAWNVSSGVRIGWAP